MSFNSHVNRKYVCNHNFFKEWSDDMAYILGFWFADGSIDYSHGKFLNTFRISQHKNRSYVLEKIKECFESTYPIYNHTSTQKMFKVYSQEICKDIINLGGENRKSLTVGFPEIPDQYLGTFIRGCWDGDGTISFNRNKRVNAYKAMYACGSESFIKVLRDKIRMLNPKINGSISFCKNSTNGVYRLYLSKYDTVRLACIMYAIPSELYLEDKWEKFMEACDLCQKNTV